MHDVLVDTYRGRCPVKDLAHRFVGYIFEGCLDVQAIAFEDTADLPEDHLILIFS